MARPLRVEYPGAFYHVTSRGNEKGRIFISDVDRRKFFAYLENAFLRFKIIIHAYCLMPNHYHFLLETPLGNISRAMHYVNSSYTSYYNIRRQRVGHLFQGRFKALLIDKDSYLVSLSRYIHLNPVRAKLVKYPGEYQWSSYKYYIFSEKSPDFLNTGLILSYFNGQRNLYKKYVNKGISGMIEDPMKNIKAGFILGDANFISQIREEYGSSLKNTRDLPNLRKLNKVHCPPERIVDIIAGKSFLRAKEKNKYKMYFLRKYTGETLNEIAKRCYGKYRGISAVNQVIRRLNIEMENNVKTFKLIKLLDKEIVNV